MNILIKHFFFLFEHQYDTKVKTIRSDNAKKIIEGAASCFYKEQGIFFLTSCGDTSQQKWCCGMKT